MDDVDLPAAERRLIEAAVAGRPVALAGETVRADTLRRLLIGTEAGWRLTAVGLNLADATIQGQLDLEGCQVPVPLVFQRCRFGSIEAGKSAVLLRDATLKRIAFYDCRFAGDLKADRATIESALFLTSSQLDGMLRLRGARIGEALAMDAVVLRASEGTAVIADGLRLSGPWVMRGADIAGEVRFANARLSSALLWEEVKVRHATLAINADEAVCEGPWLLRRAAIKGAMRLRGASLKAIDGQQIVVETASEGFNARGATLQGDLMLDGARISGGVNLGRARIDGEVTAKGAVLTGQGADWAIQVGGATLGQGLALGAATLAGGISLAGTRIAQGLNAPRLTITSTGRAIEADTMHVGGNVILRGANLQGSVRIAGARIEGQLALTECHIHGGGDLAIRADGARIDGGWFMGRAKLEGLVRLPSARLGNEMRLRGTTITVAAGPALYGNGAVIPRELVLDGGFTTTGGVVLDGAEVDGSLDLSGSRIRSAAWGRTTAPPAAPHDPLLIARYDTVAISLVDARVDRLIMPETRADRPVGVVDLSRARVGSYEDHADAWPEPVRSRPRQTPAPDHLVLDGFVYDHLETPSGVTPGQTQADVDAARMRIRWLEGQSRDDLERHFKPQAWLHVARRLAAQGYHDDSRSISIARRRRHRASASVTRGARLQDWLLDVFALYGFNPWRTVTWMAAFVLLFAGLWAWAARGCAEATCKDETVYVMALKGNFGQNDELSAQRYPAFAPLAYSLDVFLPFVSFGYEDHWRPRTDHVPLVRVPLPGAALHGIDGFSVTVGGLLYAAMMLEMLIGLVLASLAVTAFAGVLKGDDDPKG